MTNTHPTSTQRTADYCRNLYEQADELERKADILDSSLLAPSLKSSTLRAEATRLRQMAA